MTDKTYTCNFCKASEYKLKYTASGLFGGSYSICQCDHCNAFFLAPKPDEQALVKAYDVDYYGRKNEKFIRLVEVLVDYFRTYRSFELSRYLNDNANILDIGCGNGRFLLLLLKFGKYNLYGTELEGKSALRALEIPQISMKLGNIKREDYPSSYFDAITMYQVFEHLTEPKETLEIISEIIKLNGIVIISFPNINSLQSRLFRGKWFHLDPPRHLFFFKPADFVKIMSAYGFQLVKKRYFSAEQNSYGWTQSILNSFLKKREVLYERLKGNKEYAKEYSNFNIFIQKLFFVITFPVFLTFDVFESLFRDGATVKLVFKKD